MSQPFCGFEAQDVQKSEDALSIAKDDENANGLLIENSHSEASNNSQSSENGSDEETIKSDECDVKSNSEQLTIVKEIVDKVVNVALGDDDSNDQNGKCIHSLKDDPETLLFLSFS